MVKGRLSCCLGGLILLLGTAYSQAREPQSHGLPVPEALKPHIAFWTHIFTAIDTQGGVLHDADDLSVVYHTFSDLPASLDQRQDMIDRQREHYQLLLSTLADHDVQASNEDEQRLLTLFASPPSPERLRQATQNIRFQRGIRDQFARGLERSGAYLPVIRRIFQQAELPEALIWLPMLESAFHPFAHSKASAAGLWQFTPATGRLYLTIDEAVDERFDVYQASLAAVRLLRDNYARLGTWPLALTAYNHGTGGLLRAIAELKTTDFGTIVQQYRGPNFGFASRNFYAEFLAVLDVVKHRDHFFPHLIELKPEPSHALQLTAYVTLHTLETYLGSDHRDLADWNPALRRSVRETHLRIPKGYTLRLPQHLMKRAELRARWAAVPRHLRYHTQLQPRTYRTRRGDTLSAIAAQVGIPVQTMARHNRLRPPYRLRAGKALQLPYHPVTQDHYWVLPGDALSVIAERVVATVPALAQLNQLKRPYRLRAGQVLQVPSLDTQTRGYWVFRGETLTSIAERHGTTVEAIAALNELQPSSIIRAGQILRLPRMQTTSRR
jgi:membrane-bound lytic murein transglycosylase D